MPIRHQALQPTDSLTLEWGGGLKGGIGTIQVFADGRVWRDSTNRYPDGVIFGCPLHEQDKQVHISSEEARTLIVRARDSGFCRLCAKYMYPGRIYDAAIVTLTLRLDGTTHAVTNHAGEPPPIFKELYDSIIADTPPFPPLLKLAYAQP